MLILTLTALTMIPALADSYGFDGASPGDFRKPTSVDEVMAYGGYATDADNIDRSKDSTFTPPPFGSQSSYFPSTMELLTPGMPGVAPNPGGGTISNASTYYPADPGGLLIPPPSVDSTGTASSNKFTLTGGMLYADGSLGTLSIPRLGVSAKVYGDESLESLAKGIGHFESTSCWDGNVGFAAHNRGVAEYFGEIHKLQAGDKIIYATKSGTRTYEVFYVGQISNTDHSKLGRTGENTVTLVTCVRNVRDQRVCVQAREVTPQ